MTDRREQILVRLAAILADIEGLTSSARNIIADDDEALPAAWLLDGDEIADESDTGRGRPFTAVSRVTMTPEIFVKLPGLPEDVGTQLNAFRARIIKAVLTDADLTELLGQNGSARFLTCSTALAAGRSLMGEMALSFALTYVLRPLDL